MLNLRYQDLIKPSRNQLGDQGFINELYLWERLDLGLEFNTIVHLLQVKSKSQSHHVLWTRPLQDPKYLEYTRNLSSIIIYHFAGKKPGAACETISSQWHPCSLYEKYAQRLENISK